MADDNEIRIVGSFQGSELLEGIRQVGEAVADAGAVVSASSASYSKLDDALADFVAKSNAAAKAASDVAAVEAQSLSVADELAAVRRNITDASITAATVAEQLNAAERNQVTSEQVLLNLSSARSQAEEAITRGLQRKAELEQQAAALTSQLTQLEQQRTQAILEQKAALDSHAAAQQEANQAAENTIEQQRLEVAAKLQNIEATKELASAEQASPRREPRETTAPAEEAASSAAVQDPGVAAAVNESERLIAAKQRLAQASAELRSVNADEAASWYDVVTAQQAVAEASAEVEDVQLAEANASKVAAAERELAAAIAERSAVQRDLLSSSQENIEADQRVAEAEEALLDIQAQLGASAANAAGASVTAAEGASAQASAEKELNAVSTQTLETLQAVETLLSQVGGASKTTAAALEVLASTTATDEVTTKTLASALGEVNKVLERLGFQLKEVDGNLLITKVALDNVSGAAERTTNSFNAANGAIGYFGGRAVADALGVRQLGFALGILGRALAPLNALFVAAFPLISIGFVAEIIQSIVDKIEKADDALRKLNQEFIDSTTASIQSAQALELQNDRLEDQIAKLEGRPSANKLKDALIETSQAAEKLSRSMSASLEKSIEDIEKARVGWFNLDAIFGRRAPTSVVFGLGDIFKDYDATAGKLSAALSVYQQRQNEVTQATQRATVAERERQAAADAGNQAGVAKAIADKAAAEQDAANAQQAVTKAQAAVDAARANALAVAKSTRSQIEASQLSDINTALTGTRGGLYESPGKIRSATSPLPAAPTKEQEEVIERVTNKYSQQLLVINQEIEKLQEQSIEQSNLNAVTANKPREADVERKTELFKLEEQKRTPEIRGEETAGTKEAARIREAANAEFASRQEAIKLAEQQEIEGGVTKEQAAEDAAKMLIDAVYTHSGELLRAQEAGYEAQRSALQQQRAIWQQDPNITERTARTEQIDAELRELEKDNMAKLADLAEEGGTRVVGIDAQILKDRYDAQLKADQRQVDELKRFAKEREDAVKLQAQDEVRQIREAADEKTKLVQDEEQLGLITHKQAYEQRISILKDEQSQLDSATATQIAALQSVDEEVQAQIALFQGNAARVKELTAEHERLAQAIRHVQESQESLADKIQLTQFQDMINAWKQSAAVVQQFVDSSVGAFNGFVENVFTRNQSIGADFRQLFISIERDFIRMLLTMVERTNAFHVAMAAVQHLLDRIFHIKEPAAPLTPGPGAPGVATTGTPEPRTPPEVVGANPPGLFTPPSPLPSSVLNPPEAVRSRATVPTLPTLAPPPPTPPSVAAQGGEEYFAERVRILSSQIEVLKQQSGTETQVQSLEKERQYYTEQLRDSVKKMLSYPAGSSAGTQAVPSTPISAVTPPVAQPLPNPLPVYVVNPVPTIPLPHYQEGGLVPETGPAVLHAGELVIPADQVGRGLSAPSSLAGSLVESIGAPPVRTTHPEAEALERSGLPGDVAGGAKPKVQLSKEPTLGDYAATALNVATDVEPGAESAQPQIGTEAVEGARKLTTSGQRLSGAAQVLGAGGELGSPLLGTAIFGANAVGTAAGLLAGLATAPAAQYATKAAGGGEGAQQLAGQLGGLLPVVGGLALGASAGQAGTLVESTGEVTSPLTSALSYSAPMEGAKEPITWGETAKLAADMHVGYVEATNTVPSIVIVDPNGQELLARIFAQRQDWTGINVNPGDALEYAAHLHDTGSDLLEGKVEGIEKGQSTAAGTNLRQLATLIERSYVKNKDAGLSVVLSSADTIDDISVVAAHEAIVHGGQRVFGKEYIDESYTDVAYASSHPLRKITDPILVEKGYDPSNAAVLTSEVEAYLLTDDPGKLGLTPAQAAELLSHHYDALERAHGTDALSNTPKFAREYVELLQEARSANEHYKYEARLDSAATAYQQAITNELHTVVRNMPEISGGAGAAEGAGGVSASTQRAAEGLTQSDAQAEALKNIANPSRDTAILNQVKAEHPDWTLSQQLQEAAKRTKTTSVDVENLPHYQSGGYVPETGPAILHAGEHVIPADQAKKMRAYAEGTTIASAGGPLPVIITDVVKPIEIRAISPLPVMVQGGLQTGFAAPLPLPATPAGPAPTPVATNAPVPVQITNLPTLAGFDEVLRPGRGAAGVATTGTPTPGAAPVVQGATPGVFTPAARPAQSSSTVTNSLNLAQTAAPLGALGGRETAAVTNLVVGSLQRLHTGINQLETLFHHKPAATSAASTPAAAAPAGTVTSSQTDVSKIQAANAQKQALYQQDAAQHQLAEAQKAAQTTTAQAQQTSVTTSGEATRRSAEVAGTSTKATQEAAKTTAHAISETQQTTVTTTNESIRRAVGATSIATKAAQESAKTTVHATSETAQTVATTTGEATRTAVTSRNIFQRIALGLISLFHHTAHEAAKTVATSTSQASQTAVVTSTEAQQTAATIAANVAKAASYAGVAGAAGTASWAGAPWPIDAGAPGFGAAMAAAAAGFGAAAAAEQGYDVPSKSGVYPTILHPAEMVLPANLAQNVRNMTTNNSASSSSRGPVFGGNVTFNAPISTPVADPAAHADAMFKSFQGRLRKMGVKGA